MKTKIFALFLGLLCLLTNALAQSETLTGFNGRIKFTSFANNGLYVRGTLDDFIDQTNQYVASDIDSADVVWDNLGRRYLVHAVLSSNLTQAVVDLSRIGGGTHIPIGVGFVSRETSNGLALIPPVNSTGISTQLASRAGVHNMKTLEGLKTIYTGSDSVRVPNLLVKLAQDGNQNFGLGYWPNFPDRDYMPYEYGIYISPNYYGEITIANKKTYQSLYDDGSISFNGTDENGSPVSNFYVSGSDKRFYWNLKYNNDPDFMGFFFDSLGFRFYGNSGNDYILPNPNISSPKSSIAEVQSQLIFDGFLGRFIQSKYGVFSSTTNGSGDIQIIVPEMPDNSYSCLITIEGTTSYTVAVHTKTTTSFKVRFFNPATGAAVTATSVSCSYKIEDY